MIVANLPDLTPSDPNQTPIVDIPLSEGNSPTKRKLPEIDRYRKRQTVGSSVCQETLNLEQETCRTILYTNCSTHNTSTSSVPSLQPLPIPDETQASELDLSSKSSTVAVPSPILNLPNEIFHLIFAHLSIDDIINLSCTNSLNRSWLIDEIFRRVRCSWQDLQNDEEFLPKFLTVVSQLRIENCYTYGEWHLDVFQKLQTMLPQLNHLLINSNDSSNWLKYRSLSTISKLSLYNDDAKLKSTRIFDLNHLHNFPSLQQLHLYEYHFDWRADIDKQEVPLPISHLVLHGCSWEYPFKLSQFNESKKLTSLSILYDNHSFVLSERFNEFLNTYDENLATITNLTIKCNKSLSPLLLQNIVNNYPGLQALTLHNWQVIADVFIPLYLAKLKWNRISKVSISLQGEYQRDILKYAEKYLPNITFSIRFVTSRRSICH